ncbi:MAG TPA: serine/threonine-protein kinase [Gemmatimonadales bacterium]|nr:serine/threonine-protein kinase [Gemmatimonadales bacterium]
MRCWRGSPRRRSGAGATSATPSCTWGWPRSCRRFPASRNRPADRRGFLAEPLAAGLAGVRVGACRLERALGQGGMGSVWLARRTDGRFEGRAAVRFPNLALLSPAGRERFRREGSALARLGHPGIARLLDAGVGPAGQPYLILEYVDGQRIDAFVAERRLSLAQRIELFLQVLGAVGHAHANLIVQRDLKPSNIFVAADGSVKLLDFGIPKLLDAEAGDERTAPTLEEQALTSEYAAPEQVRGRVPLPGGDDPRRDRGRGRAGPKSATSTPRPGRHGRSPWRSGVAELGVLRRGFPDYLWRPSARNPRTATECRVSRFAVVSLSLLVLATPAAAQAPAIVGTWKFDLKQRAKEGPRTVVVRADSSASYGTETVRWRLRGKQLWLALGGEWVAYDFKLKGNRLTLSGGDLTEPIQFDRVGPATPRPDSVPLPPDPDLVAE